MKWVTTSWTYSSKSGPHHSALVTQPSIFPTGIYALFVSKYLLYFSQNKTLGYALTYFLFGDN